MDLNAGNIFCLAPTYPFFSANISTKCYRREEVEGLTQWSEQENRVVIAIFSTEIGMIKNKNKTESKTFRHNH